MKKNNQQGQSTIEFIVCFAFGVSVIFMVFNSAMNYASGYIAHYATFMVSRYYLTQEKYQTGLEASLSGVDQDAKDIFKNYYPEIFGISASSIQINTPQMDGPGGYLMVGAYSVYDKNIDIIGQVAGQKKLRMVSESFLGKEPPRYVCFERVCQAITGATCNQTMDITIFDDGC
jgi:hypothetical protein